MKRDYAATVAYLFGRLPMYQRTGDLGGKLDLSRTRALLGALGDPQRRLACLHVGGTNGKGSVSHALASLLTAQGRRVGLYTSPHYVDYRERIRVDGEMVAEDYVVDFVARHEGLIERVGASFFEFTVALAFSYFAEVGVDLAVIEVGLGGRLDSTNVIEAPLVSTITNIDLEHTEVLGGTRAAIAQEKAGIIKPGRPAVIGRYDAETWPVFASFAERQRAPLVLARDRVRVERVPGSYLIEAAGDTWEVPQATLDLRGPFATENLQTALATYRVLAHEIELPPWDLSALTRMRELSGYTGRFLTLAQNPLLVADAGHNPAAWSRLVPEVVALRPDARVHVVCGFVAGKRPLDFLALWPAGTRFYLGELDLPRNRPTAETLAEVAGAGLTITRHDSIAAAYEQAANAAADEDLVFVGGSSYVVGAFLEAWSLMRD